MAEAVSAAVSPWSIRGCSNLLLVYFLENVFWHPSFVLSWRPKFSYDQIADHDMHKATWWGHHVVLCPKLVEAALVFSIGEWHGFDCLSISESDALWYRRKKSHRFQAPVGAIGIVLNHHRAMIVPSLAALNYYKCPGGLYLGGRRRSRSGKAFDLPVASRRAPEPALRQHCGRRGLRRSGLRERLAGGATVAPPRRNPARSLTGAVPRGSWSSSGMWNKMLQRGAAARVLGADLRSMFMAHVRST